MLLETQSQLIQLVPHVSASALNPRLPLCQLPAGATGRVCELTGDEGFRQRLREMGAGEAALITKISGSSTSLCLVNSTRIALNHRAAMSILVEPLPAGAR
jgi:ferrous iron transport protein A